MSHYECKFNKAGNRKVGARIYTFNKLAGAGVINGCKGTCGDHCQGCYNPDNPKKSNCYVFKSYVQYGWDKSTVVQSHVRNTKAIEKNLSKSFDELELQLKRSKTKPTAVRIHSSGELTSPDELKKWIQLAYKFPNIPFYIYTKAYDIIDKVLSSTSLLPSNFFINISIWHESGQNTYNKWKHVKNVRAFIYEDGYKYPASLKPDIMCPAYDMKGKLDHRFTCDTCKICFRSSHKICGCWEH